MHSSAVRIIFKEVRIRVWWIFFCAFVTCATCYWFSEELLFILSKPYLKISKTNFFICTQITESLNTYITISIILGFFFCAPYIIYQIWCFFIPSCSKKQRSQLSKIVILSGFAFFFVLFITFFWILPNIWFYLSKLSNTEVPLGTQLFFIKLQPKIYDFSILTLRILFFSAICSQIPVLLICSIQYRLISIQTLLKSRKTFLLLCLLFAALITPPDIWCQLCAWLLISIFFELAVFTAILYLHYID